jgi:hypothetical protein
MLLKDLDVGIELLLTAYAEAETQTTTQRTPTVTSEPTGDSSSTGSYAKRNAGCANNPSCVCWAGGSEVHQPNCANPRP